MKRILFIVGSMRENSFNRQLAKAAAALLEGRAETAFLDYADVPFVNQDIEYPAPREVERIRAEIAGADGIWIVTPEYNHSYPGVLKNLIDWASRPLVQNDFSAGTALLGKRVALSGVAGKSAAADAMDNTATLLRQVKANLMDEPRTGVALNAAAFKTDVLSLSEDDKAALAAEADAFLAYLG